MPYHFQVVEKPVLSHRANDSEEKGGGIFFWLLADGHRGDRRGKKRIWEGGGQINGDPLFSLSFLAADKYLTCMQKGKERNVSKRKGKKIFSLAQLPTENARGSMQKDKSFAQ